MERREHKFQLISNRFTAIIAVCLTGFLATRELRAVFTAAPHKASWLIALDSLPLPTWSVVALNLFFYAYMLWLAFWFFRGTEGKERVVVAGFCLSASLSLLSPIEALSFPPAITVIRIVRAASIVVAFFATLFILLKSPAFGKGDAKTALRLLLFLGAFVVFAFAIGAAVYFIWR